MQYHVTHSTTALPLSPPVAAGHKQPVVEAILHTDSLPEERSPRFRSKPRWVSVLQHLCAAAAARVSGLVRIWNKPFVLDFRLPPAGSPTLAGRRFVFRTLFQKEAVWPRARALVRVAQA